MAQKSAKKSRKKELGFQYKLYTIYNYAYTHHNNAMTIHKTIVVRVCIHCIVILYDNWKHTYSDVLRIIFYCKPDPVPCFVTF